MRSQRKKDDGFTPPVRCAAHQGHIGVIRNEMVTAQIGTTATYTASDWWVDALGADLGIVVTEVGMVFVPDVEDTWLDKYRPVGPGRPDAHAAVPEHRLPGHGPAAGRHPRASMQDQQAVPSERLLGRSGPSGPHGVQQRLRHRFVVTPANRLRYDFEGTTPCAVRQLLGGSSVVSLSVTGTLNNNFRVGASYSDFFGGHIANKAKDQDFASVTASYTF